MIDKVDGKRIANDIDFYLIALFRALQNGWIPPGNVSEEEYIAIKNNIDNFPPELVGFVGYPCSYAGKWFGGYARGKKNNGIPRNYADEGKRHLLKQAKKLNGVKILNKNYLDLKLKLKCIIYCDPPYENTTKYKNGFNHKEFWNWVRKMKEFGHSVFISEYSAPEDFECIWEKDVCSSLTKETGSKRATEKLFV